MKRLKRLITISMLAVSVVAIRAQQPPAAPDPNRWEPAIQKFEEADKANPPALGGIVFVGASSIVRWKLDESFPDLKGIVLNRGFGGSEMSDAARYASRIVVPYKPRVVVLYSGDNDIGRGVAPEAVETNFEQFVRVVRAALPDTRIVVIAVKPSLLRWAVYDNMKKANALMKSYSESHKGLTFVEVGPSMLGSDGKPRPELFVEDGLHMTPAGYAIWNRLVRPYLQ